MSGPPPPPPLAAKKVVQKPTTAPVAPPVAPPPPPPGDQKKKFAAANKHEEEEEMDPELKALLISLDDPNYKPPPSKYYPESTSIPTPPANLPSSSGHKFPPIPKPTPPSNLPSNPPSSTPKPPPSNLPSSAPKPPPTPPTGVPKPPPNPSKPLSNLSKPSAAPSSTPSSTSSSTSSANHDPSLPREVPPLARPPNATKNPKKEEVFDAIGRIDLAAASKKLSTLFGSQVDVVVDWDYVMDDPIFIGNKHYAHDCNALGIDLIEDLCGGTTMTKTGFFPLFRLPAIKAYIVNAVKLISITSNPNEQDHISFGYSPATKCLTVSANLQRFSNRDKTQDEKKIAQCLNIAGLAANAALSDAEGRLKHFSTKMQSEIGANIQLKVDWGSFANTPSFASNPKRKELITYILSLAEKITTIKEYFEDHPELKEAIKQVKTYTVRIDPTNKLSTPTKAGLTDIHVTFSSGNLVANVNMKYILENTEDITLANILFNIETALAPATQDAAREKRYEKRRQEMGDDDDNSYSSHTSSHSSHSSSSSSSSSKSKEKASCKQCSGKGVRSCNCGGKKSCKDCGGTCKQKCYKCGGSGKY